MTSDLDSHDAVPQLVRAVTAELDSAVLAGLLSTAFFHAASFHAAFCMYIYFMMNGGVCVFKMRITQDTRWNPVHTGPTGQNI